jgi:hypothetical protein
MPLPLFKHKRKHKHKNKAHSPTNPTNNNLVLNPRPRGNKRPEIEELKLKNEILNLSDNHTDFEIQKILKLPNSTYYRYKQKIFEDAREIWKLQYEESQSYRILHTINAINLALRVQKEIVLNNKNSAKDRLDAADKFVELEMNFLKLISDMNENENKQPTPSEPRPTTYPTIPDPNNPGKWLTDPAWIESNIRNLKR